MLGDHIHQINLDSQTLDQMGLTTHDLLAIMDNHQDHTAKEVMSGLMHYVEALEASMNKVSEQLQTDRSISVLKEAITSPFALAMRFSSPDFVNITRRAKGSLDQSEIDHPHMLSPDALSDIIVWQMITTSTIASTKMLFHLSMLYGIAPNGKSLRAQIDEG